MKIKPNKMKKTTVGVACYATPNNKQSHVGADALKSALKGVTLPALVITIIIMLILAGVTLNLTIGERGFFKSTQELQDIQTIAEYKERVEISRAGTAVDNLGIVTLDNLTNQIYKEQVVPEGSIRKIDEEKAQMTTPEGYVFIITADGIEYIDKEDAIPVPPDLTEANVEFKIDPETWTNKTIKISIEQKAGDKFIIEYSTDAKEWKKYTKEIETDKNTTIYARLKNPIGVAGNYASEKISNIDKLDPIKIVPTITATTNTITIDAGQASDATATNEDGCSGIKQIYYSKDEGKTWQTNEKAEDKTYTYKELEQNKTYKIQVRIIDNAGNQTITNIQEITTRQVDIAEGNVTIGNPTWNASTHKASVSVTKGTGVSSTLSIQYQVVKSGASIAADKWTTGTSVTELSLNDTVYARLWDGTNGGAYTSLKITESTAPTVTVNITGTSTNSITASVTSRDDQSGMPTTPTYTFYLKKTSEADTAYVEKHTGTETSFTFTKLAQTTGYTVKVETKDNAGNKGAGTKTGTTGTVPDDLTIELKPTTWTNGDVTVTLTAANGGTIYYGTTSTEMNTKYTAPFKQTANGTIYYYVTDGTNKTAAGTLKIANIDKTVPTIPTITYNGGANTCSWKNNYNITLTSNDSESGIAYYEVEVNGTGTVYATTGSNFIPPNEWSSCTTRFRAVDNVGNRSGWTEGQHIHMDTTSPSPFTISISNKTATGFDVTINGTVVDNVGIDRYDYLVDGKLYHVGKEKSFHIEGKNNATYKISVGAWDVSGNYWYTPEVLVTIPLVGFTGSGTVDVEGLIYHNGAWNAGDFYGCLNAWFNPGTHVNKIAIQTGTTPNGVAVDYSILLYYNGGSNPDRTINCTLLDGQRKYITINEKVRRVAIEGSSNQTWIAIKYIDFYFGN